MNLTKRFFLTAVLAGALMATSAMAQDIPEGGSVAAVENTKGPLRIVFQSFQNNPFWIPVTRGAEAAKAYLAKYNVTVDYVDLGDTLSAETVIAGIESAIAQDYDGIVTVPIFDGTERAINEAVAAGIPVVNIIAEGNAPSDRLLFIGQDATAAGAQLGQFIGEKLGGKGKVGVITGFFGAAQHTARMDGAVNYLKANFPGIQIIGPFENQDKAEIAYSIVQDMYTANPDLSLVYVTAGGPFGAAKAIQDLGLTGKVGVVGFDHTPENVAYLKTGEAYAFIDQAPFQQALDGTVRLYNNLINGEAPTEKVIAVEGNILTPENVK